ncbi:MAG: hypothetical protein JW874_16590 [Spirochaetales bacterium]|nr:hypothetical protein [Spirochaetales bacterium]
MKKNLTAGLLLLAAAALGALDIQGGGSITALAACSDRDNPALSFLFIRAAGELKICVDGARAFISAGLLADPMGIPSAATSLQETLLFSAGEIWAEWETAFGTWKAGRQLVRWGQGLALPVLDIICPVDYSRMFSGEGKDDHIPVTALHWKYSTGPLIAEVLWIPVFTASVLPAGPMPGIPDGTVVLDPELPRTVLEDGEWGGRLRLFLPFGDLGAVVYYGWDDLPAMQLDMVLEGTVLVPQLSLSYERLFLTGLDAAIPLGPLLMRLEAGVFWDRTFPTGTPGAGLHHSHQGQALLGIDWMPGDWKIIAEAFGSCVFRDNSNMTDPREQLVLAGEVSRSFDYGKWEIALSGLWNITDEDWYLNPELRACPAEGMTVTLGAQFIEGDDSLFALVEDDISVYTKCRYSF